MNYRITACEPRPNYRLWLLFADGTEGVADLSALVGRGVFAQWTEPDAFARVSIDPETGTVIWPGGLDLAPDALYREIARRT